MLLTKIALIVPPNDIETLSASLSDPPIGIASIAGYLESQGIEVIIIDALALQLSNNDIIKRLNDNRIKLIGISCNYCTYHNNTLNLAKEIKNSIENATVFIGGNHATAMAEQLLVESEGNIDCIIRGEGEITVYQLVVQILNRGKWSNVSGILYYNNGDLIKTSERELIQDLDSLPLPAYHLLPMECYQRYNVISSRGCPFGCDFCASTVLFSRKVRYRSPEKVFSEVKLLIETYGHRKVWFSDDTFTVNRRYTNDLLDKLIHSDMKIEWSCLTTVNTVEYDLLTKMRLSGCQYISYGVESGHPEFLRKYIRKPIDREGIIKTSKLSFEAGLPHYGFFIFGFPSESWETIYDTYDLILQSRFSGGAINILIPLPGTPLWRELHEEKKYFLYSDIKWNQLFARGTENQYSSYVAELASRWCKLSDKEIVDACTIGEKMFPFTKYVNMKNN